MPILDDHPPPRAIPLCAVLAAFTCGPAVGRAQDDPATRLFATDAARWLRHADPVVRGEAALVTASRRSPRHHDEILALAGDEAPEARRRGLLALGIQGTPGVEVVLERALSRQADRTGPDGLCAAYALGALPPDRAPSLTARILASFVDANWKRQGPVLLALLHGLARHRDPGQTTVLRQLYEVQANRDPALRAMLLALLLRAGPPPSAEELLDLFERAHPPELRTAFAWLAANPDDLAEVVARSLARIAVRDRDPALRASALAVLVRARDPRAVALGRRLVADPRAVPSLLRTGAAAVLSLGTIEDRRSLERRLASEAAPSALAALLASWNAPPSAALADRCADLAADDDEPDATRYQAAMLLARGNPERARPLVIRLFARTVTLDRLDPLARAALREASEPPAARLLLPPPPRLSKHPRHWWALLRAGHPDAMRRALAVVARPSPPISELRLALAVWRTARITAFVADPVPLPPVLAELLAPP